MLKNIRATNPAPGKNWKCPPDEKPAIFIHSAIDEYGLNIYEFRVLAHVARRVSKNRGCDASQAKIAKVCGMSQRKVLEVLAILSEANILYKTKATEGRRTNSYRINPGSKWKHPSELEEIRLRRKKTFIKEELETELKDEGEGDEGEGTESSVN